MGIAETFLKTNSVLNTSPWDIPPAGLPIPSVSPLVKQTEQYPNIVEAMRGGLEYAEPDLKAAKSRASSSIGPLLAFLPLMLGGVSKKNRKRGLAAFAAALANATSRELTSQNAVETWRAEQLNKRQDQALAAAMEQLKGDRAMLEKAAGLDPSLWGDEGFVNAYQMGDITYLPSIGWKPPVQADKQPKLEFKEVNGQLVSIDPYTGEIVNTLGRAGSPKQERTKYAMTEVNGRRVLYDPYTGQIVKDLGGVSKDLQWIQATVIGEDGIPHKYLVPKATPHDKTQWVDLGAADENDLVKMFRIMSGGDMGGGSIPTSKPSPNPNPASTGTDGKKITQEEYNALKLKGFTDEQIEQYGYIVVN